MHDEPPVDQPRGDGPSGEATHDGTQNGAREAAAAVDDPCRSERGLIAWFVCNPVAANLLFGFLIVAGLVSLIRIPLEVFPDIDPDLVTVQVVYPGASPEEVEDAILLRLEEAIADVEGVEEITSTARQGLGFSVAEIEPLADKQEVRDDIKGAVARIAHLPPRAEAPIVSEPGDRISVLTIALHGDADRVALNELAKQIEDDLVASDAISTVEINGLPAYEVSIEIEPETLRGYDLTFDEVARAMRRSSLDLSAGELETVDRDVLLRTTGQAYRRDAFERLPIRSSREGGVVRLGEIATVVDRFEDTAYRVEFDGEPAVLLTVYRIGDEGALQVRSTVRQYLDNHADQLPPGVQIAVYNDAAEQLANRIRLLLKNAAIGFALVVLVLGLFLELRLALWAAAGMLMSFAGSLAILPFFDVAIHQISLFGFILVLGIVVDDAIVVGENIYQHRERGKSWRRAAIDGVREVGTPVFLVVLSTIVAFLPMLFVRGEIGKVLYAIPLVVISVLVLSLVEALLILPAHLSHERRGRAGTLRRGIARVQSSVGSMLQRFIDGPFRRAVELAVGWRYVTIAAGVVLLLITLGYTLGGFIGWQFFPDIDANRLVARLEMPPGVSSRRTEAAVDRIAEAARALQQELAESGDNGSGDDPASPIRHIQVAYGGTPFAALQREAGAGPSPRDARLGEVVLTLSPADVRSLDAKRLADRWRERVGTIPGVRTLSYEAALFSVGEPISVRLEAEDEAMLRRASGQLQDELARIAGVREISDSILAGQPQIRIRRLTAEGLSLGFTRAGVAQQVRAAFFGLEAERVQRGDDEVRVYVRYPDDRPVSLEALDELRIRQRVEPEAGAGPRGGSGTGPETSAWIEAPLHRVAHYELGDGVSRLTRAGRDRVIDVTADVDEREVRASSVNAALRDRVLPELIEQYPGLRWSLVGQQEEQRESMRSLLLGLLVAIAGVYVVLAGQFRDYFQPLLILFAIPFGVIGAVWGHVLVGLWKPMPLSFMSIFGVVALAGVVVNDALILIDLANRFRAERAGEGESGERLTAAKLHALLADAAQRRCRPIMLTTLTTFLALTPLILETSFQAQFLIPTAVSLGFGVLLASAVTLLLVPAAYAILEDARRLLDPPQPGCR